jgi:imidazoleglycerol phosphate synthase glutamine amidotransferase subunit HisH
MTCCSNVFSIRNACPCRISISISAWKGGTGSYAYFAHSYAAPADAPGVALTTTHGIAYCAALARENLLAVQFHPEKSQKVGLALLERFVHV